MVYSLDESQCKSLEFSSSREWLLTNGIGGYAMGTVSGINTRRYHGHLVAAIEPPSQRVLLLAGIEASVTSDGAPIWLSTNQYPGAVFPEGYLFLESFHCAKDRAVWRYKAGRTIIEKRLTIHKAENALTATYTNVGDRTVSLELRPLTICRSHHGNFAESASYPNALAFPEGATHVEHDNIELSIRHPGAQRTPVQGWYYRFEHVREVERGLDPRDDLYCPCHLVYRLSPGESASICASVDSRCEPCDWDPIQSANPTDLRTVLVDAAEHFLVESDRRTSILAGYPWFTDWGRDTMISLPGICLGTGRVEIAQKILKDYGSQLNQGLIPNRFQEDGFESDYNTVDATLWFVQALYATLLARWDESFAREMHAVLSEIYSWHLRGTHFGIRVDSDGLLTQGQSGVQLTWMDAKVGDWVITPRHGKPVEINGLWINALRVMEWLSEKLGESSERFRVSAEKAESAFEKFWCESKGHYFDTIDPFDVSLRPNQLIAMSLPFGPAKGDRAVQAIELIRRELLTTVGLRTLGPSESGYRGRFEGPLAELDSAYHQGTVWPWLLGPYISALIKLTGDKKEAKAMLRDVRPMLLEYGLGGIAEVYDGDDPRRPNGCPWQAWSVAEILRVLLEVESG